VSRAGVTHGLFPFVDENIGPCETQAFQTGLGLRADGAAGRESYLAAIKAFHNAVWGCFA